MKKLSRREFLKICAASGAAVGLSQLWIPALGEAFDEAAKGKSPVVWLQGSACGGCSTSLLNSVHPELREILSDIIDLTYHPNLSQIAAPMETGRKHRGKFILVIEGAIPKASKGAFNIIGEDSSGKKIPLMDVISNLGEMAATVLAVGTCASYGGISAVEPNDSYSVGVENLIESAKVINIPGCPPHPDWIVGTLGHLMLYGKPELDEFGRPVMFYGSLIHNNCPLRHYFDNSIFATKAGEVGCTLMLGCKGPIVFGDCPTRLWNGSSSWCVGANAPCIGCTDPKFPEITMPFSKKLQDINLPGISSTADTIGKGLGIATAAGIAAHFTGSIVTGRVGRKKQDEEGVK